MEARLLDEVRLSLRPEGGDICLRLWRGRTKLAVEVVVTGLDSPVLDAVTAPDLNGVADWLERVDPLADAAGAAGPAPALATGLWDEAICEQWRSDFRWLVGEALFRWQGLPAGTATGLETAA